MRLTVLLPILLTACASSGPTTYDRGTFTPPPPAPTRPGVGLPQPHMPGQHVGPKVEPNPRPKRRLPPTPGGGPGIWAGNGPVATHPADPDAAPALFRVPLPLPENQEPEDAKVAGYCAASMDFAAAWAGKYEDINRLRGSPRQCLAAMLYAFCMEKRQDHQLVEKKIASRRPPVRNAAKSFVAGACTKEMRDEIKPLADVIASVWTKYADAAGSP